MRMQDGLDVAAHVLGVDFILHRAAGEVGTLCTGGARRSNSKPLHSSRTLMKSPVVKRRTPQWSGFPSFFRLLLQGKVHPDYACNEVTGAISRASLAEIRHPVRSRVLELTVELEKSIPEASAVELGKVNPSSNKNSAVATQIAQQIICGNVTSISATGDGARINVAVGEGDVNGLIQFLVQSGLPETDARQLGQIVASEEPESRAEPMGTKARKWLVDNLKKAADGTWKMGVAVATDVIQEVLLKYYRLK